MTTVVITGLARDRAATLATEAAAGAVDVTTASDYDGALALQTGEADYYVGLCQSGAGAALAMAIGLVGSKRARTVAPYGKPVDEQVLVTALADGVVAFGISVDHVDTAVPMLLRHIADRHR